jgi:hypothetical protein
LRAEIARGRSCASILIVPRRETTLIRALHEGMAMGGCRRGALGLIGSRLLCSVSMLLYVRRKEEGEEKREKRKEEKRKKRKGKRKDFSNLEIFGKKNKR